MTEIPGSDKWDLWIDAFLDGTLGEEDAQLLLEAIQGVPEIGERFFREHGNDFPLRFTASMEKRVSASSDSPLLPWNERSFPEASDAELFMLLQKQIQGIGALSAFEPTEWNTVEAGPRQTPQEPPRIPTKTKSFRPLLPMPLLALVILLVFLPLIYREWNPSPDDSVSRDLPRKPNTPALVIRAADVVWAEKSAKPLLGEPLLPGALSFESGTVELLFFNGVRAVVEGPAEIILMNEFQVFCRRGYWSVDVPPQGVGFEIQTPHLVVRDLGTKFFTSIDGNLCDVHVLQGRVEVKRDLKQTWSFNADQAASFQSDALLERFAAETKRFVDHDRMGRLFEAFLQRTGQLPDERRRRTLEESEICSVDFRRQPLRDAAVYNGLWTTGDTPDSLAFRFDDPRAKVRLKPLGTVSAFTAALRLRVDRLNPELNPILMSEGARQGGILWHITPRGTMLVGIRQKNSRSAELFETPVLFTDEQLGRWTQLALSLDGQNGTIRIFMDGNAVFFARFDASFSPDLSALDVGNWTPQSGTRDTVHHLDGAVETVRVFDHALSLTDIRSLFSSDHSIQEKNHE